MELLTIDEVVASLQPKGLPDFVLYQYWKNLLNRKIVINEEITKDLIESAVLPYIEMNNDGSGKPIEIYLDTVGGEVYPGFCLVDQIEKAKTPTTIHILSRAVSMGMLIAMAGKNNPNVKTVCHPFSIGLLHSGSQYLDGTAHAVKDTFNFTQSYEKKIKDYVISHSKIDENLYDSVERVEYWMDADEMLKRGIVDEII